MFKLTLMVKQPGKGISVETDFIKIKKKSGGRMNKGYKTFLMEQLDYCDELIKSYETFEVVNFS